MELDIIHSVRVPDKIKLSRGMKGAYGFEISVSGETQEEIIKKLKSFDAALTKAFPTEVKEKEKVE